MFETGEEEEEEGEEMVQDLSPSCSLYIEIGINSKAYTKNIKIYAYPYSLFFVFIFIFFQTGGLDVDTNCT
jgi:hypothetical protein